MQVVAEVVLRQRVTQRDGGLLLTTSHTTNKLHLGIIVEIFAGLVFIESTFLLCIELVVSLVVETITEEHVTVLHGLDAVVGTHQHVEGKLTLVVGDHLTRSIVYLVAVDLE